jgi:hypothetical protein
MKKFIVFAVVLALLVPVAAFAKCEFSLGGYIKMEVIWDSTQTNRWLYYAMPRNNDLTAQHGRLKFSAENSRMNFTIKGPDLWGAKTTGFIEWDFDSMGTEYTAPAPLANSGWTSPHKMRIGLRHCMFRLNWPTTELLLGQYWSMLTEEVPETVNFGASTTAGFPFIREPQIRLTQLFSLGGGKVTASIAACQPMNDLWGLALNTNQAALGNQYPGESTETPRVEGRVKYDIDLWGKAAFWGVPRPFSVRLGASWQRERFMGYNGVNVLRTFGESGFNALNNVFTKQQYLDKWFVEGSLFVPLLATHTKNLAGTASLLTQWWVGAGLDNFFEDMPNSASFMTLGQRFGPIPNNVLSDRQLLKRFGGFVQLQYYFTNQWYVNGVWGVNKAFDVSRDTWVGDTGADPLQSNQHFYASLWYRPIQALKFGVEYTYVRSLFFQKAQSAIATPAGAIPLIAPNGQRVEDLGENHRVMFAGYFFF